LGESLFAIRRGEVTESALPEEGFQPMPDSRKMEDLRGSGEFESRRSRRGDFRDAMDGVRNGEHQQTTSWDKVALVTWACLIVTSADSPARILDFDTADSAMSLQSLISGSECAIPANPLSQVVKHTEKDRSLQHVSLTDYS
jgi:hypothetical protein